LVTITRCAPVVDTLLTRRTGSGELGQHQSSASWAPGPLIVTCASMAELREKALICD
jgi:hypothetical protein